MATIANAPGGQDACVGGSEKIPCDDAGTGKYMTVDQIKAYVIDAVEAIAAGTVVDGNDKLYILDATDSVLKPVDIDTVLQHIVDAVWAKTALTAPAADDVFLVKDGGTTEKTMTMAVLSAYILSAISSSILNVSGLDDGSGSLATTDYMLVTQGTIPRQITVAHLNSLIYSSLQAYITALTAVTTATETDVFYCIQGGTPKKVTLTTIISAILSKIEAATGIVLGSPVIGTKLTFDETTNDLDITATDQSVASSSVNFPDLAGIDTTAVVIPTAVDGTLATGANTDFAPTKLVYNKTCADSDGDDVIDLHNGTYLGQILTVYLGTKGGTDNAVITPVTALGYTTITLDAANEIATLQWQGATVGWAILYTTGTIA